MKKAIITSSILSALAASIATAATAYDPFLTGSPPANGEYSTGNQNLAAQNPTVTGWTGGWAVGASFNSSVSATGLAYSDGSNNLVTDGGSIFAAANSRVGRGLSAPATSSTTSTLYMSLLFQLDGTVGYNAFEMHDGGFADTDRTIQLGVGGAGEPATNAGDFGLKVNNSSIADLGTADNNTNLFVVKFNFSNTGSGDSLSVWRNPTLGGAEPTADATLSGFDLTFDRTTIARFGNGTTNLDELRFGTSFADVTPIPEPSSALLIFLASVLGVASRRRRRA